MVAGVLCHLPETGLHSPATSQWSIDATSAMVLLAVCLEQCECTPSQEMQWKYFARSSTLVLNWHLQTDGSREGPLNMQSFCPMVIACMLSREPCSTKSSFINLCKVNKL